MPSDDAHRRAARRTLTGLQPLVEGPVRAALRDVADRFTAAINDMPSADWPRLPDDVARWWTENAHPIGRALLALFEAAVEAVARWLGVSPPADYQDLPARFDTDRSSLPQPVRTYLTAVEGRLTLVGDNLRDALAAAVASTDPAAIRQALTDAMARAVSDARADRIATTETTLVWNIATADTVRAVPPRARPTVKRWLAVDDHRTRLTHRNVDGTIIPLNDRFVVGGVPMVGPGDQTAPLDLWVNCRCVLLYGREGESLGGGFLSDSEVKSVIHNYEQNSPGGEVTAASGGYTGAMIALVPSAADAQRLALDAPDALPADELHLTLLFLGDASDWPQDARNNLVEAARNLVQELLPEQYGQPIHAAAFGAAHWIPTSDAPAWVWSVSDDRDSSGPSLLNAVSLAWDAVGKAASTPEMPAQHSPWQPHVTAAYTTDDLRQQLVDRLGPITFDRLRVAFGGETVDIPLTPDTNAGEAATTTVAVDMSDPVPWDTPGDTALAFEDQETGDGRIFSAGALYWDDGPWPLQYADEMLSGHDGAELAGAITTMTRDGGRLAGTGVLYPSQPAGRNALMLLTENAPLGVSVDLDDVDIELVDRTTDDDAPADLLMASLPAASVLHHPDGSWTLTATTTRLTADGGPTVTTTATMTVSADGTVPAGHLHAALTAAGITPINPAAEVARLRAEMGLSAAAGDPDRPDVGTVVHAEQAGDLLIRITRARVRGATLVSMPAFAQARITLTDATPAAVTAATAGPALMDQVVGYVAGSPVPVDAAMAATALQISIVQARGSLARAAKAGLIVRLSRGWYVAAATLPETRASVTASAVTAAVVGDLDLPVHTNRDAEWDGDAAASRVLGWATDDDGTVDPGRLAAGFLYRAPDSDPATLAAYKLGFADVYDGRLEIVARGVFAVAAALQGARGGVDIPDSDRDGIRDRVEDLYERINEAFPDAPPASPPWDDDEDLDELEASAWQTMRSLPPMPAEWFREPTPEELPPGSGGVHYRDGRIYGWVAQAGVPHDGFPDRRLTVDSLGSIDLTHFLRARFALDDGSAARVGALTMNVGHHRDGAECETAACQFDDTRTVAGIVTVGINAGGMWFSGAAAPWLSEWDTAVFQACQPSYHLKRDGNRWSLRAVLSVPVPGHPSRLAAAAVERSNLALAASAHPALDVGSPTPTPTGPAGPVVDYQLLASALADELERRHLTTIVTT